jgi:dolichol kinase
MVDLVIGDLFPLDILMALFTGFSASVILTFAYFMARRGYPNWQPRKLVHTTMSTVIAFTVFNYTNLSGPAFAAGVFLTVLMYAWGHKSELISELLVAGSREGESKMSTFAAGFMGMISYAIVFLLFFPLPEIFVAAILAVGWGDAAGEVIGRPFGGKILSRKYRNKTIEGSLAVWLVTCVSVVMSLLAYSPSTVILAVLPQIVIIGGLVMLTELLSIGWTDNFFIPMVTAFSMWLLLFPHLILFSF